MSNIPDTSAADLAQLLQTAKKGRGAGRRLLWGLGIVVLAAVAAVVILRSRTTVDPGQHYVSSPAEQGDLTVTATATGTLQPTTTVDVGSELSGTLATVLVEDNDVVTAGQLLAELDTSKLKDAVAKSQAAVAVAEASVATARATVAESRAKLTRMREVAQLSGGKVPAKTELETAEATLLRAQASEASAKADVVQARATLKSDETNLGKAAIKSPVNGVVLSRKVEPGNTVAATMTTPVLFELAEDLAKMELQVNVDEADVAGVHAGQQATFTVSAWPGRKFPATIKRVGLGSTTTDNVVTYKTILEVQNDDLALRPGMTATATIVTARRSGVLLVPNAALRFTPPETAPAASGGILSRLLPHPPRGDKAKPKVVDSSLHQVWVLENGEVRAVAVTPGVSDGRHTEILSGELQAGMAVVTEYQEKIK